MKQRVDESDIASRQSIADEVGSRAGTFQFRDNRPKIATYRAMQAMADDRNEVFQRMQDVSTANRGFAAPSKSEAPIQRTLQIGGIAIEDPNDITHEQVADADARDVIKLWIRRAIPYEYPNWDAAEVEATAEVQNYNDYIDADDADMSGTAAAVFTEAQLVNLYAIGGEDIFTYIHEDNAATARAVCDTSGIGAIEHLWSNAQDNFMELFEQIAPAIINQKVGTFGSERFSILMGFSPSIEHWIHLTTQYDDARLTPLDNEVIRALLRTTDENRLAIRQFWLTFSPHLTTEWNANFIVGRLNEGDDNADLATALRFTGVTPVTLHNLLIACNNLTEANQSLTRGITDYGLSFNEVYGVCNANPNAALAVIDPLLRAIAVGKNPIPVAAIQYLARMHGIGTPGILSISYRESRRTVNEREHGGSYHIFRVVVNNALQLQEIHSHVSGTAYNSPSTGVTHYKTPGAGGRANIIGGALTTMILGLITASNHNRLGPGW